MYPSTSFQRSHGLPIHVCIISPALHIDMQFSSDVIIKIISIIGFQTYSKHIPSRSYAHPIHPSEEPCTSSTYSHHLTYVTYRHEVYIRFHHEIAVIGFQTYSKRIPSRSYVRLVHPSEEPCTSSTYFHHLSCITYKHTVYMRCHHKNNCNHRFSNLFQHTPPRSYVHSVHPSEEPCTPSTSFRGALYPIHILPRIYVLQGHTFIISLALHTSMRFT